MRLMFVDPRLIAASKSWFIFIQFSLLAIMNWRWKVGRTAKINISMEKTCWQSKHHDIRSCGKRNDFKCRSIRFAKWIVDRKSEDLAYLDYICPWFYSNILTCEAHIRHPKSEVEIKRRVKKFLNHTSKVVFTFEDWWGIASTILLIWQTKASCARI